MWPKAQGGLKKGKKKRVEHVALVTLGSRLSPTSHTAAALVQRSLQVQPWAQWAQPVGQHEQQPGDSWENEGSVMTASHLPAQQQA